MNASEAMKRLRDIASEQGYKASDGAAARWAIGIINRLPRTADGVPVLPGMDLWQPGRKESAVAGLRARFDRYPIYASGWAMNVNGEECYSTREAAKAALAAKQPKEGPPNADAD